METFVSRVLFGIIVMIALCIVLFLKLAGIILVIADLFYKNFTQQLWVSALINTVCSVIGLFLAVLLNLSSSAIIVLCFLKLFIDYWLFRKSRPEIKKLKQEYELFLLKTK